jgi:hypothetical protein
MDLFCGFIQNDYLCTRFMPYGLVKVQVMLLPPDGETRLQ